ncbi:virulence RhuM family protein [Treponema sp.]|uniref:virulence RhuM family protein n=1 Tax=Treponema sp. TaxID=166 RepID=UPI003FD8A519
MEMKNNTIILFTDGELELQVPVSENKETVWLNRNQMAELFERDVKTIGKHINNALEEELDSSTVAKFATVQKEGNRMIERNVEYYNLDMIISVGYRVKSSRGVTFRRWANSVLKQYIVQGYAINKKRLEALEKTVSIQTRMLANTLNIEEKEIMTTLVMNMLTM